MMRGGSTSEAMIRRHHEQELEAGQCGGRLTQPVAAPAGLVWSLVRDFSRPHAYKRFVRSCSLRSGDGATAGSLREVRVVSGLPAAVSMERLDRLDHDARLLSFSIVGGDHRLRNYRSTTTVHDGDDQHPGGSVVIESYVVDVPPGSTADDTRAFAETIIRCNLTSLATTAHNLANNNNNHSSSHIN